MIVDLEQDKVLRFFETLETSFRLGLPDVQTFYPGFTTSVQVNTATAIHRWLQQHAQLREWIGERVINNLKTEGFTVTGKKWESTFGVSRRDVDTDQFGLYAPAVADQVRVAARHKDNLSIAVMEDNTAVGYDGKVLFATDHPLNDDGDTASNINTGGGGVGKWYLLDSRQALQPVLIQNTDEIEQHSITNPESDHVFKFDEYLFGLRAFYTAVVGSWWSCYQSDQALNETNLDAAMVAMSDFKDKNGDPMGISPDTLMVGTKNGLNARKLIVLPFDAAGASNAMSGALKTPIVNPYIANV